MAQTLTTYRNAATAISDALVAEQYAAAVGVNARQLTLYYNVGCYLSLNTRRGVWGQDAIGQISRQLQSLMPGLRGFSATNMRLMRLFYEAWNNEPLNSSVATDELQSPVSEADINSSVITDEFGVSPKGVIYITPHASGGVENDL
ncbi:MAG: hypothetical protein IJU62_04685 [Muribaculaceae bacterium]|nr:hypothetical protein [Muribaculaceae bacterium]